MPGPNVVTLTLPSGPTVLTLGVGPRGDSAGGLTIAGQIIVSDTVPTLATRTWQFVDSNVAGDERYAVALPDDAAVGDTIAVLNDALIPLAVDNQDDPTVVVQPHATVTWIYASDGGSPFWEVLSKADRFPVAVAPLITVPADASGPVGTCAVNTLTLVRLGNDIDEATFDGSYSVAAPNVGGDGYQFAVRNAANLVTLQVAGAGSVPPQTVITFILALGEWTPLSDASAYEVAWDPSSGHIQPGYLPTTGDAGTQGDLTAWPAYGQPNGVATLDGSGLVPDSEIPATITRDSELAAAFASFVAGAPGSLDTWLELTAAIQSDQSGLAALTTVVAGKAPLVAPTFTGHVTVPTPTSSTDAATKAYADTKQSPIVPGLLAARPSAATAGANALYFASDDNGGTLYRSDGATWTALAPGASAGVKGTLITAKNATGTPTTAGTIASTSITVPVSTGDVWLEWGFTVTQTVANGAAVIIVFLNETTGTPTSIADSSIPCLATIMSSGNVFSKTDAFQLGPVPSPRSFQLSLSTFFSSGSSPAPSVANSAFAPSWLTANSR